MMDINVGLLQRLMIFLKKKSIVSNTSRGAVTGKNIWNKKIILLYYFSFS